MSDRIELTDTQADKLRSELAITSNHVRLLREVADSLAGIVIEATCAGVPESDDRKTVVEMVIARLMIAMNEP